MFITDEVADGMILDRCDTTSGKGHAPTISQRLLPTSVDTDLFVTWNT